MKKVNFKNVLMALTLALTFLLAGVERTEAQTIQAGSSSGLFAQPAGNFVNADAAEQILLDAMRFIREQQLAVMLPGTTPYNLLSGKVQYYAAIYQLLLDGKTVPAAIAEALPKFGTDVYGFSRAQLKVWKDEAVDLLN